MDHFSSRARLVRLPNKPLGGSFIMESFFLALFVFVFCVIILWYILGCIGQHWGDYPTFKDDEF